MEIRVIDCDAIVLFVDYGTIDSEKNGGWSTKMRCKKMRRSMVSRKLYKWN